MANEILSINDLSDDCLIEIFQRLSNLDRIRLENVCRRWRVLSQRSWQLVKTMNLTTKEWEFVSNCNKNVVNLFLAIFQRCGKFLQHVNFTPKFTSGLFRYHSMNSGIFRILAKQCPNMQSVDVTSLIVTAIDIEHLSIHCHDIRTFKLCETTRKNCELELIKLFKNNKNLRYVKIINNPMISGKCLLHLPNTIEVIVMDRCLLLTNCFFPIFERLIPNNLKTLFIEKPFHDPDLIVLLNNITTYCTNLTSLHLIGINHQYGSSSDNSIVDFYPITRLTSLEILNVAYNTSPNDQFLMALVHSCLHLSSLNISGCYNITDRGLSILKNLKNLVDLKMNELPMRIKGEGLIGIKKLNRFKCRSCYVTNNIIIHVIRQCENLEILDLRSCKKITTKVLDAAVSVTSRRTNKIVLKLYTQWTVIDEKSCGIIPKLLKIMKTNDNFDDEEQSRIRFWGGGRAFETTIL